MSMDYLKQAMQARNVDMGGVEGKMRGAIDGFTKYTAQRDLIRNAAARGMGMPGR